MEKVALGSTGLFVSRMCLGIEGIEEEQVIPVLREAAARNVTWWDITRTAPSSPVRAALHDENRDYMTISAHAIRLTPATTAELDTLIRLVNGEQVELKRLDFLWRKAA